MALDLRLNSVNNAVGIKPTTATITPPKPVGVPAVAPTPKAPVNTIPKAQVAPKDFSGQYGLNNGTVYDKNTGKGFSSDAEFKAATGFSSNGQKFDTTYKSGVLPPIQTATVGSQVPNPASTPTPSPNPTYNPTSTTPSSNGPYTPPNQGTTGVSQGGIIGNLIGIANNETPEVTKARSDLQTLNNNYAKQTSNIEGSPIDLSLATGQEGILNRLFAAKQGAAQTALSSALTSQGQQISANSSAGGLNAPIQAGAYTSPSAVNTTGQTTSGASNLDSLIGQRMGGDGKTTEYFDKSSGKGFSTPQELADYVNKQTGGNQANATNVFDLLKSGALNNPNGGGGTLNPLNNIPKLVSDVISEKMSYNDALSQGGTVANFAAALKAAISQADPSFDFINSQASAAAKAANIQNQQTAGTDAAKSLYLQKYPEAANLYQALNNVDDAGKLTVQNAQGQNINPFQFVPLNTTIADARRYFSSQGQATFDSNIINLRNLVQNLNASGGGNIPSNITESANGLINGTITMSALQALITAAKQEGQLRFNNALGAGLKGWNDLQTGGGNTSSSSGNPQGWF